jgi:uncharacterized protein YciI/uncharacterized protein YndB with AHSA1/START domain
MTALPPIHREVVVNAEPATAFAVFTDRIGSWWPLAGLSVFGEGASVAFTGGELVETSPGGETSVWGTVIEWRPPEFLSFTWHPGRDPERATEVRVQFVAVRDRTLVVLEHFGWDRMTDPVAAREEYGHGWPAVLAGYASHVDGTGQAGSASATWVALLHRSTISASVFDDPRFAEHVAFLQRRAEAGELVAAGSLDDADGEGMTVLRLAGEDRLDEARRLATEDDASVAGGLFEVTVRPWRVVLSAD